MITQERLKQVLHYSEQDGVFTRISKPKGLSPEERDAKDK